eukprot:CAMPEP_0113894158 /NCGR_PEP_ID=MMETSP0780_2-20120614/16533_1 /TAXON_ID=652834 /ORGANISM="Palpitomonas bilix" /LENGTH=88 /DNA_ID=CAMNT_0000884609 /DNA_START=356 /DNA_END=620 /DNA_ORIENTATION=+ /assembly_acc=CAM_ASM_000599
MIKLNTKPFLASAVRPSAMRMTSTSNASKEEALPQIRRRDRGISVLGLKEEKEREGRNEEEDGMTKDDRSSKCPDLITYRRELDTETP